MKRRASLEFDSLELLLDTICNTFGGILFLAVLVIMLVHRTGESLEQAAVQPNLSVQTSLPQDLEQRQSELQSLERAFKEYRSTLAGLETDQVAAQAHRVLNLRNEAAELTARRVEYVRHFASLNEEIAADEKQRQNVSSSASVAKQTQQSLIEQLDRERKNRTRTASLPVLRQTTKREFPIIVRFGRLYIPFTAETGLATRKSNLSEFVILDDNGPVIRVTPKPYAGLPINDDDHLLAALRQKLNSIDHDSVYLAIGVWEDSFEQFQILKERIVKLGFEYRLVPIASGEFIQESPVKETLVQ
jgi:hypothetical protein